MGDVLAVLLADWQDPLRCTNIEQAMARAGRPYRDAERWRIARTIQDDPGLADLLRWHPSAYVLSNDERLVARAVHGALGLAGAAPGSRLAAQVVDVLAMSPEVVGQALDALQRVGFLVRDGRAVWLSGDAPQFLEGVGFFFHEVRAGDERFNVNCFHDFVLLTSPSYRARRLGLPVRRVVGAPGMTPQMLAYLLRVDPKDLVRRRYDQGTVQLDDACAHCMRRIRLTVADGHLVTTGPPGVWHVRGGGCGVNNLFCSRACAEGWVEAHPRLQEAEQGPVTALWT